MNVREVDEGAECDFCELPAEYSVEGRLGARHHVMFACEFHLPDAKAEPKPLMTFNKEVKQEPKG